MWVEVSRGHAYTGVGGRDAALGGPNVGAPPQQIGRKPNRNFLRGHWDGSRGLKLRQQFLGWTHDQPLLDRPGNNDIQLDIFYDYRTNLPFYPKVQEWFRRHQPPTLIVWGKNDKIFPADGARPYLRDLPHAELHLLDTGHFALEDRADVMVPLIRDFLDRKVARK